jgi:uncharacterized protein YbbC (DUF1343 family)/CubicO group peptidase (beta-lactamase class C family)
MSNSGLRPAMLGIVALASVILLGSSDGQRSRQAPAAGGLDPVGLDRIETLVHDAIQHGQLPGAVVAAGRREGPLYLEAFGNRSVEPSIETMTTDTVFDLASLTKVVATATSVIILVEEGRLRLADRVAAHFPEFGRYGKQEITIRHLLTHVSGLRPGIDLADAWSGAEAAIQRASDEVPLSQPGQRFIYSDINYIVLAEVVARLAGMPFERFATERLFKPLGMRDTTFLPSPDLAARVAPTERCALLDWPCGGPEAPMLRGLVHDPTARRMGGVAGHAGLFSTATDLAVFCRMMLGGGQVGGTRILSPAAVAKLTTAATSPEVRAVRGLGWDIDTAYSSNRGELFPIGSFGHTGFTGTSIWIDPHSETFVVFLSNRLHPDGKGDVTPLRAKVSTAVGSALTEPTSLQALHELRWTGGDFGPAGAVAVRVPRPVRNGVDELHASGLRMLQGRRVGLLTNHTGRSALGTATIDLLHDAAGVELVALFSPEHGIRGDLDARVSSSLDEKTGLPIHSLYGDTRRPTNAMLEGMDTIVIDLQDIGARFYTYVTTMAYVMEEAATRGIRVVVLDRPNPINGFDIEGPSLDAASTGFTGYHPMPIRHGMTIGELAALFNEEKEIGADLTVVQMTGWGRDLWFDQTGLFWVNPSPNMRNMIQASLYPGIGAIEGTNISVGRGTDTPFEQLGAPWIDGSRLAAELNARQLPGVRFYPVAFTPSSSKYAGEHCQGTFLLVTDRTRLRPVRVGLEVAATLHRLYPGIYQLEAARTLMGSAETLERVRRGDDPADIAASWASDEAKWRRQRARYLMY